MTKEARTKNDKPAPARRAGMPNFQAIHKKAFDKLTPISAPKAKVAPPQASSRSAPSIPANLAGLVRQKAKQTEEQAALRSSTLNRLSTTFSASRPGKVSILHRAAPRQDTSKKGFNLKESLIKPLAYQPKKGPLLSRKGPV